MEAVESFGAWLKKQRRALDLTQQALADRAGCSLVTIRKFESDERRPSRQLAELLADCLAITADERETFIAFARQPELTLSALAPPGSLQIPPLPAPAATPLLPPPRKAVPEPPINLPAPLTGLIGRETDVAAVCEMLLRPSVRLVTLTGAGGTGKTRLAIETAKHLAADHPEAFPDGLFLVDLASLMDPGLFLPALAEALGVVDSGEADPIIAVGAYLRTRRMLLVLDNFEQIVEAADDLAELLQAAGGVSTLVTSRVVLRVYGEHEYPVAPLAVPAVEESMAPEALLSFPAIALFVERSRAARPGFALTVENAAAVREICTRLDGLPLAIELVAARSKLFAPAALLSQLAHALDLAAWHRYAGQRQQTMRGAIDWSYRLLSSVEQLLFRALGVILGDFGLDEVKAVAGLPDSDDHILLDLLVGLVEKSMIHQVDGVSQPRFRLLFVLREFAAEQLVAHGELDVRRLAHHNYFLMLAEDLGPRANMPGHEAARNALRSANDDLRAAMSWAFEGKERVEAGLQIALALTNYWIQRGMLVEGQSWFNQGLNKLSPERTLMRAQVLIASGRLAYYQGKYREAVASGQEALALLDGDEAEQWRIIAHRVVGNSLSNMGDLDQALTQHQNHILEIYRRRQNTVGVAQTLQAIGLTTMDMGLFDAAIEQLTESVALFRTHPGEADDLLFSLNGLGAVMLIAGRYDEARPALEESLALARKLETPMWEAMCLANLAHLNIPLGHYAEARRLFADARRLAEQTNGRQFVFQADLGQLTVGLLENEPLAAVWPYLRACLDYHREQGSTATRFLRLSDILSLFCARSGRPELAARLIARAEVLREQPLRPPRFANVQPVYEQAMSLIEEQLDPASRAAAFRDGAATPEETLVQQVEVAGHAHAAAT
jgi:predicted ATPase/transcriptional regulator with XRE-family HTH domain